MWHPIEYVAESHFLDPDITMQVANENSDRLSLHKGTISTMFVDKLISLVIERQGDQTEAIRLREQAKYKARYA